MTRQLRRAMEAPTMMPVPLDDLRVGDLITRHAIGRTAEMTGPVTHIDKSGHFAHIRGRRGRLWHVDLPADVVRIEREAAQ